jgi:hypothetical protein
MWFFYTGPPALCEAILAHGFPENEQCAFAPTRQYPEEWWGTALTETPLTAYLEAERCQRQYQCLVIDIPRHVAFPYCLFKGFP